MHNPLNAEILEVLRTSPDGISEYELMQVLAGHEAFKGLAESAQLALFQKHFLVMNALYTLQQSLWEEEQLYLEISPLKIRFATSAATGSDLVMDELSKLGNYYCDWANFNDTTEAEVNELLGGFWERFLAHDRRDEALAVLGLGADASQDEVRRSYRRLAAQHHPDKGGDRERFIEVRQAYETLIAVCKY